MTDFINRIRKKALTDEEVLAARQQEQSAAPKEDDAALVGRLQGVMDEAIPLVEDVQSLEYNIEKLRRQFTTRGFAVSGKVLSTKKVNVAESVEYTYNGEKVFYPKEYAEGEAAPSGVELTTLTEYQINVQTRDGTVQLHVVPPNWPRNPNDKYEGHQSKT